MSKRRSMFLGILFFITIAFVSNHALLAQNKDTTIQVCTNKLAITSLSMTINFQDGSWTSTNANISFENSSIFNTNVDNLPLGSSSIVWKSTNNLEIVTIFINNKKPLTKIFEDPIIAAKSNVICDNKISLWSENPKTKNPDASGIWSVVEQPSDNLSATQFLNSITLGNGDTLSTLSYNIDAVGKYVFKWKVTDNFCGSDSATYTINNHKNIAKIVTKENEINPTCGLPVNISAARTASSSKGAWRIGRIPNNTSQNPVLTQLPNTSTRVNVQFSNFSLPGNYDLWWIVTSNILGECPSDSQFISISNIKPLAELNYTTQFVDVCGSTSLGAKNPSLTGTGLIGKWIVDRIPLDADPINAPNLTFNSNVKFSKPGNYYFKWLVYRENPNCVSDTSLVVFNNIKPSIVSAGRDTSVCSSIYELKGSDRTIENLPNISSYWQIFTQPSNTNETRFDDSTRRTAVVSNMVRIGKYGFIWNIITKTASITECVSKDTVFITNNLHPPFSYPTNIEFCDSLNLPYPIKDFPKDSFVPVEGWSVLPESNGGGNILISQNGNNIPLAFGFPQSGEYKFLYTFEFGTCKTELPITAINLKPSRVNLSSGREFCADSVLLSAPQLANGFRGLWELVSSPNASLPIIREEGNRNTSVRNMNMPGAYSFRWTISSTKRPSCVTSSNTVTYTNQKASKLSNMYFADSNYCNNRFVLKIPPLDLGFLYSNTAFQILNGDNNIITQKYGNDSLVVSGLKNNRKLEVVWTVINPQNPLCVRNDTIFRVNQQPNIINSAGDDIEICQANTKITLAGKKMSAQFSAARYSWQMISKPNNANFPRFLTDSTIYNAQITGFTKPGEYVLRWHIENLNCKETDETKIINNAPDTIFASANNRFTCKNFDTLVGYKLPNLDVYKNAKYLWTVSSQPPVLGTNFPKANIADSTKHIGFINNMFISGDYKIRYTISNGTCSLSDTFSISRSQQFDALVQNNEIHTCNDTVLMEALASNIKGKWQLVSGGRSEPIPLEKDSTKAIAYNLTTFERNIFSWVIAPPGCRESIAFVNVFKYPKPSKINLANDEIFVCESKSAILMGDSVNNIGSPSWYTNSLLFARQYNPPVILERYGMQKFYYRLEQIFKYKGKDSSVCASNFDSVLVYRDSIINYEIELPESQSFCKNNIDLSTGVYSDVVYKWSVSPFNPSKLNPDKFENRNANQLSFTGFNKIGKYVVYLELKRGACSKKDSIMLIKGSEPSVAKINTPTKLRDSICTNEFDKLYQFVASAPELGSKGFWIINDFRSPTDTNNVLNIRLQKGVNKLEWVITNKEESCKNFDTRDMVLIPKPEIAFAGEDKITSLSEGVLDATPIMNSIDGKTRWISPVNTSIQLLNPELHNTSYTNLPFGKTFLVWELSNPGCPSAYDTLELERIALKYPKLITPNGDAHNQTFYLELLDEFKSAELSVYNRNGDLVYQNKAYNNDWAGQTNDGKKLPDDTYYYTLKLGNMEEVRNYVIIKR